MDTQEKHLLIAAGVAVGAVVLIKIARSQYATFAAADFFQPVQVASLAETLHAEDEDQYILNCWNWVGTTITYEAIGSDIDFEGETIRCLYCWSVEQTLARGVGNCVCKSAVLASLLLNRLEPERVHMVIGGFSMDGVGGHAWVLAKRGGVDYVLEATSPPRSQPWASAESMTSIYIPYAVFSPVDFTCVDHNFCLKVNECDCGRRIQELL